MRPVVFRARRLGSPTDALSCATGVTDTGPVFDAPVSPPPSGLPNVFPTADAFKRHAASKCRCVKRSASISSPDPSSPRVVDGWKWLDYLETSPVKDFEMMFLRHVVVRDADASAEAVSAFLESVSCCALADLYDKTAASRAKGFDVYERRRNNSV